jgi:hypothetical protein
MFQRQNVLLAPENAAESGEFAIAGDTFQNPVN